MDSGEGRLRKPSQGPHASSALGRVLRPRPGLRSFGENSDPSGTGSKGPCTTPGPSPHSEIGPWAESTPPAPTTPSLHGTSTQLGVERCSTLLPGAPSPSPWKTTPPPPPINPRVSPSLEEGKRGRRGRRSCRGLGKGYGHSVIFLAYFLTTLSSLKRNRDRLTVRQFCRTGMGLYRAMVRALCAIDCLYILCAPGCPPCRLPPAPRPPPAPTTTPAAAPEPPPP